ncbi:ADP-dependent (S)-NAD(P)H-hydrate dehydratase [uncultured archaeon]|nr:ADP-dependent (S)-NAD(P)H-hydrate dehydratase [uncultured archaeon]
MQELKEFAEHTKKVLSASDMQAIELNAAALGVSGSQLMENAGMAVAKFIEKQFAKSKNVLVICGLGWKGGSGFAASRHLIKNHHVTIGIVGYEKNVRFGPALEDLKIIRQSPFGDVIENVQAHSNVLNGKDVIVDAVFGVGFHGKMTEGASTLIKKVNDSKTPVVSIDIPSGLDANTCVSHTLIAADYTVTFHKEKSCLDGLASAGKVVVEDIGIPIEAEIFAGPGDLMLARRPRSIYSSKHDNGSVVIIAGSRDYHGAPVLAANAVYNALAALRMGTGYVHLYVPAAIEDAARRLSPNVIVRRFGTDYISDGDFESVKEAVKKADAVIIGMGIGRDESTLDMAARIIDTAVAEGKKIVIDADAIYAVKRAQRLGKDAVLTPQDIEFHELSGLTLKKNDLAERFINAVSVARKLNASLLLKGHDTIITDGEVAKIVRSDTSALATMGTGDVLSGIIGGYAAIGATVFESATAGAYLHATIGGLLALEKGNHILAVDVVDKIPKIIKDFDESV